MLRIVYIILLTLVSMVPVGLYARDSDPAPSAQADPDYVAGRQAAAKKDWARAIELFNKAITKDARNADILNSLGYAHRNNGQMDIAFKYYEQALAINPRHRGAHEYVGEAYLMVNNLAKAEEHLAALDKLCFLPCEEYTDLKRAVTTYKNTTAKAK